MKFTLFWVAVVLMSWSVSADDDKVKIGVKKRIDADQCPIKSRKGDIVHVHYVVSGATLSESFETHLTTN